MSECYGKILAFKFKHLNICLEILDLYRSDSFNFFLILKVFGCVSIERQIMDGLACFFLQNDMQGHVFFCKAYVPCQTSISYSKNGLMRE